MTINTAHIQTLLRPGLQQVFSGGNPGEVWWTFPRVIPVYADWRADWRAEYERELRLATWCDFLAKHTPNVRARLERLNPYPPEPGAVPRGYHKKWSDADIWVSDLVTAGAYQKHWGYAPLRAHIRESYGRKKYVTSVDYADGTAHNPPCVRR